MNPETTDAKTLDELLKKVTFFGPSDPEMSLIQNLLLELKAYREGGVTEEILRRNDGYIKVGRGCVIATEKDASFIPWNHPLRLEAEQQVQKYYDYAQTHLASDNKRELSEMFLEFLRRKRT